MRTKSRYRPKGQERATLSLDARGGTEQRPLYTTNCASWLSIVSATHLDFNASIVVTRPFISYGFYRRRYCRCGNILNDVEPPSDGCDDKSSESIATQAARWRVPSGRFSSSISIQLTDRLVTTHTIGRGSSFSIVSRTFHASSNT